MHDEHDYCLDTLFAFYSAMCRIYKAQTISRIAKVQINFGFSVPEEGTLTIEETIA